MKFSLLSQINKVGKLLYNNNVTNIRTIILIV